MDELIKYYYDKFMIYIKRNRASYIHMETSLKKLKESLKKIIEKKRDTIFTDAFISSLCYSDTLLSYCLHNLASDNENKFYNEIVVHFWDYYTYCHDYHGDLKLKNLIEVELLDEETTNMIIKAYNSIQYITDNYEFSHEDENVVKHIILGMLSKCFIEQKMSDFPLIADRISQDPVLFLDDLIVNGIDRSNINDNEKNAIDRVTALLGLNNKRTIV